MIQGSPEGSGGEPETFGGEPSGISGHSKTISGCPPRISGCPEAISECPETISECTEIILERPEMMGFTRFLLISWSFKLILKLNEWLSSTQNIDSPCLNFSDGGYLFCEGDVVGLE